MSVTCPVIVQSLILELCGLRSLEVSGVTEERGQPTGRLSLQTHSGAPQMQVGHRRGSLSPGGDPKAATVTAESWVPRGLAGDQSRPSLTWRGSDALRGFLAFSLPLLLFSNWFLTFLKDNSSHITLLPKTLQSHLEKCKPRESGDGVFPVHQVPGAQHSSPTHRI